LAQQALTAMRSAAFNVDPIYQGKGAGARLMDVLEGFAREEGVTTLSVPPRLRRKAFIASAALSSCVTNSTEMKKRLWKSSCHDLSVFGRGLPS
jgi:GNAT superfamily N-acetyltransferase